MARKPIHPGEILGEELAELNMSAAHLARAVHVPANRISQILAGKRSISADTALRLGKWFGTCPHLWLNLQKAWELDVATLEVGSELSKIIPLRQNSGAEPSLHKKGVRPNGLTPWL